MSAAARATSTAYRWHPPRQHPASAGARWADWVPVVQALSGHSRQALLREVGQAEQLLEQRADWSVGQLQQRLGEIKALMRTHGSQKNRQQPAGASGLRAEALACIALAARHSLAKRPYPVQMLAALAMHQGFVVQMAAGEGKTIAVALAAVMLGWSGLPCHVITSNDYLAQRDVELMGPLFRWCGVSVAAVVADSPPEAMRASYQADVAYATGKQLLADFLRDQIILAGATDALRRRLSEMGAAAGQQHTVMRGLHSAIVDEADSVLVDEATTPLIISAPEPSPMMVEAVQRARAIAGEMVRGADYNVHPVFRDIEFTRAGEDRLDILTRQLPAVWHAPSRRKELVGQALTANDIFHRDRHYIVDEGKILIVDENTGRAMPGRTWSYGLHQAIEAKEQIEITPPTRTMARMTFQDFFRRYHRLSGASGTLQGIRNELWWTYGLMTFVVPTRLPSQLVTPAFRHFASSDHKQQAVLQTVVELHRQGHPVLVGTRRISDSETLDEALRALGLHGVVLNAKQHATEALVIENAGQPGHITVATNMAGRGTDIHIGADVAAAGGLHVLMLEPHESARVDWQLFGRAGRQGARGFAQGFISLEDDLLVRHTPWFARPLGALARLGPRWRARVMPWLHTLAQFNAQWRAWRQRKQLQQRELQLRKQLSFTDDYSPSPRG